MGATPGQKLSALRRDKVARARHAAPSDNGGHGVVRAPACPWRPVIVATAMTLAGALCQRLLVDVAIRALGLDSIAAGPGLSLFTSVSATFAVAALYGATPAATAGVISSIILWAALRFNPSTLAASLAGTLLVAALAHRVRRAADLAIYAMDAFFVQAAVALGIMAAGNAFAPAIETCEAWHVAALAVSSLVGVPLAILVALPIAERLSGRTSDCTLAPYANLEHPLLQRLSREAPGTYGHSMLVADLAAAAAEAVGANPLLARLGGYYHDVGKLSNPRFFMENQTLLGNPHDALPPSVSAMIVASHVKDGAILAREHGLPQPIVRVIATHHGTSAMAWFRRKAIKLAEANGAPAAADEWPYRYAGPLPETREESIVSIADSVEAASRSIAAPTQPDLVRLVNGIVADRLADGQLARSALTLRDLEEVKRTLVQTLVHRLHARAPYPPAP